MSIRGEADAVVRLLQASRSAGGGLEGGEYAGGEYAVQCEADAVVLAGADERRRACGCSGDGMA